MCYEFFSEFQYLYEAAMNVLEGVEEGVKRLIAENPDGINTYRDSDGESALHWTVKFNHLECFEVLIQNGADVNVADSQ